jgi:hypothetical protein
MNPLGPRTPPKDRLSQRLRRDTAWKGGRPLAPGGRVS